ncbi:GspE/PulE family protein [Parahaliea aestuarii]|uniref:Type II/IV secretion system protein n=1 Tax=Parahaliea aestuarii TaxID=1852021 RepID=A0A5C8ZMP7_9GAMM|nr:GspE/PulE family protein [Parahaliea aestuarii]TXS89034.1 type II/IV secretion system protein [Parahaliea aestuarii]
MSAIETTSPQSLVSLAFAREHNLFVQSASNRTTAYITSNTAPAALLECQRIGGPYVDIVCIQAEEFIDRVNKYFEEAGSKTKDIADQVSAETHRSIDEVFKSTQDLLSQSDESAPVVRLINAVLVDAIRQKASDIHVETYGEYFAIRYRIDGVLQDIARPSRALVTALVSRIKVMAHMDIAEKRVPQDGSITVVLSQREFDVRVSTLPTRHGERIVLRLLSKDTSAINLNSMGLSDWQRITLETALNKPQGLVLITGPTGSGKSTTLYAGIQQLDTRSKNILTVEDPIEYELEGIGQTQVNPKAGMSFAKSLRAMLRQDPDVVMVGEIRDPETVQTAIQASLTGHLVLSTLHTNTAIGAVSRLVDMDAEPFLVASTIELLVSQRLVRLLCIHCRKARKPTESESALLKSHGKVATELYDPVGCPQCSGKGYAGRIGIFEFIPATDALRLNIHNRASEQELISSLGDTYTPLLHDGLHKASTGLTTLAEVMRVSSS